MSFFFAKRNLHFKSERELTVLKENYRINIVIRNFFKVLGAVQEYRLAIIKGTILTFAVSSKRKVGKTRMNVIRE